MTDWTRDADPAAVWDDEWHEDEPADGEWEDYREPRGGGCARKLLVSFLVLVVVGAVGGFLAWTWVQDQIDPPGEPTGDRELKY